MLWGGTESNEAFGWMFMAKPSLRCKDASQDGSQNINFQFFDVKRTQMPGSGPRNIHRKEKGTRLSRTGSCRKSGEIHRKILSGFSADEIRKQLQWRFL